LHFDVGVVYRASDTVSPYGEAYPKLEVGCVKVVVIKEPEGGKEYE